MISLKEIREDPDRISQAAASKGESIQIEKLLELDNKSRELIQDVEEKKAERNRISEKIAQLKREGDNADGLISEMRELSLQIKEGDGALAKLKEQLDNLLRWVPNVPHESVPVGDDESANELVRTWGEEPSFDFTPLNHTDLAESLELLDFTRAAKISGSGFPLYTKSGARLERALINFMLEHHSGRGYSEVMTPFMALESATEATGQLPKLEEDMYRVENDGLYLIPTAEVPITNIHREEILKGSDLPIRYVAYSPCFRREAGSYGKETRGLLRIHQFNKVEMVKFVHPNSSYDELESLTTDAESVLQTLGLHYRVVTLCTGDLSFAAAKCYDLEVWAPGEKRWLEVSSCSNFLSFQARRAEIRFRDKGEKVRHVHTLNGSGLATPRLMIALLESYQTDEGTVTIPEPLQPYFGDSILK
jgi:seryl-tRNA synthetase